MVVDAETNADEAIIARLKQHYYAIVEGIGAHKSPVDYGASLATHTGIPQLEKGHNNQE